MHIDKTILASCYFYAVLFSLIPKMLMREWKELFFRDLPLYEPLKNSQPEYELSTSLDPTELKKQKILNNLDYYEYSVSLKQKHSNKMWFVFINHIHFITNKDQLTLH